MNPEIVNCKEKKLVGLRRVVSMTVYDAAPLWQEFMPHLSRILGRTDSSTVSLSKYPRGYFENFDPGTEFEKWAAVEVSGIGELPEGLESLTVSSGEYAVFHYIGSSSDRSIFERIYCTWLPNSIYRLDNRPHFEILGEKYKNAATDSEENIYIPVILRD